MFDAPCTRLGGMSCCQLKIRRQSNMRLNRDTESVVALTPNRELGFGRRLSVVGSRARAPAPQQKLVELTGIEPVTPWLQTRCSPS